MEFENATKVIKEIADNVTQKSSSKKDEIAVMKAMINDPNFSVDIYNDSGKCGEYYPSREIRKMLTNVVSSTTKIPSKEASELVNNYEFSKSDAIAMINLSKEFINTYLYNTGRKLSLGGRITSDIELVWRNVADRTTGIPAKDGSRIEAFIPAHGGIKVYSPCPSWVYTEK